MSLLSRPHLTAGALRRLTAIVVAALVCGTTAASASVPASTDAGPPAASAVDLPAGLDHLVVMGAIDPAVPNPTGSVMGPNRTDRFEYIAYYPSQLQVHRGDVVHFRRDGYHSFTYTPPGEPRYRTFRRDEVEGVAAYESEPLHPDCGRDAGGGIEGVFARGQQPPCTFTGAEAMDSAEYATTLGVDAPAGTYAYYCRFHSGMSGTIEVVDDSVEIASPEQVEAARQAAVAADTATGEALIAHNNANPEFEVVDDHVRWTVKAGDISADGRVSVVRYMPDQLTIAPGDEVVYRAASQQAEPRGGEVVAEGHTVTFPSTVVQDETEVLPYFLPSCDPDDPSSGAPGVPSPTALFVWCPDGMTVEFLLNPSAYDAPVRAPGDAVLPGVVHDSGIMWADGASCRIGCDPWDSTPMPSTFDARFPVEGEFDYICLFHDDKVMSGSVVVSS